MSDTPETDAVFADDDRVFDRLDRDKWRDHARRLERERDEAIRQRNETNESSKFAVEYAQRERDEAIAARKASAAEWLTQIENAEKKVVEAKRERDAARALADAFHRDQTRLLMERGKIL